MQQRQRSVTPPSFRQSWPVAALEAALSVLVVSASAWYAVARVGALSEWLDTLAPTWRGVVTLTTMLVAGGLLAHAFGRAEDAIHGWRRGRLEIGSG